MPECSACRMSFSFADLGSPRNSYRPIAAPFSQVASMSSLGQNEHLEGYQKQSDKSYDFSDQVTVTYQNKSVSNYSKTERQNDNVTFAETHSSQTQSKRFGALENQYTCSSYIPFKDTPDRSKKTPSFAKVQDHHPDVVSPRLTSCSPTSSFSGSAPDVSKPSEPVADLKNGRSIDTSGQRRVIYRNFDGPMPATNNAAADALQSRINLAEPMQTQGYHFIQQASPAEFKFGKITETRTTSNPNLTNFGYQTATTFSSSTNHLEQSYSSSGHDGFFLGPGKFKGYSSAALEATMIEC